MIYNCDCIIGAKKYIADRSIDLQIHDPPFGINESSFDKHYNRIEDYIVEGYVEAPKDYSEFTLEWIEQAKRILTDNGSMYIVSGWSNSDIIAQALRKHDLKIINKIIWNFPFGVYTKNKYVTSHYEIFFVSRKKAKITFNRDCRFQSTKDQYEDMQSVWRINKEYKPKQLKNKNKLPEELIKKMILYSSNDNDLICDFFLGNFTTANVAIKYNRRITGFEINKIAYEKNINHSKLIS